MEKIHYPPSNPWGLHLYFSMGPPGPIISVLYFNNEESDKEGGNDEEQGPLDFVIIAQRCEHTDSKEYPINIYSPLDSFVRLSFVTRLTITHIELHNMVGFHSSFFIHFLLYSYRVMVHIEISNFCILGTTTENGFLSSYPWRRHGWSALWSKRCY